ncbi:DgyrCDS1204 [Dimorphilus gyrociliatus]|uniref:DgyrCDS1204 n=1 Tax=Dimorphilus gyrociliatus TaxID=2664684 RepID=A0A7I8V809_9ANNE|nr:DgyrCDS1204 [Dimorphilus gyrociliatus]
MGCGASKRQVQPVDDNKKPPTDSKKLLKKRKSKRIDVQVAPNRDSEGEDAGIELPSIKSDRANSGVSRYGSSKSRTSSVLRSSKLFGSRDSLGLDSRNGSATSKVSKHSCDSGFDDPEYAKVITEESNENEVNRVENDFKTPRDMSDFSLSGVSYARISSATKKIRKEERDILANLQNEGLIQRPVSRAAGGFSFEIVSDEQAMGLNVRKPPARLMKLEKRKKKKRELTEDDIKAKLEKAELRRKKNEQERVEKAQKSSIQDALDKFADMQKSKENEFLCKEEIANEKKNERLKEMRERLRAKERHAEEVRQRKKLNKLRASQENFESSEISNENENLL